MRRSLGIDLGTTNSVAATNAQVLSLHEGDQQSPLLPSVVAFLPDGGAVIGAARARAQADRSTNTIYCLQAADGRDLDLLATRAVSTSSTRTRFCLRQTAACSSRRAPGRSSRPRSRR